MAKRKRLKKFFDHELTSVPPLYKEYDFEYEAYLKEERLDVNEKDRFICQDDWCPFSAEDEAYFHSLEQTYLLEEKRIQRKIVDWHDFEPQLPNYTKNAFIKKGFISGDVSESLKPSISTPIPYVLIDEDYGFFAEWMDNAMSKKQIQNKDQSQEESKAVEQEQGSIAEEESATEQETEKAPAPKAISTKIAEIWGKNKTMSSVLLGLVAGMLVTVGFVNYQPSKDEPNVVVKSVSSDGTVVENAQKEETTKTVEKPKNLTPEEKFKAGLEKRLKDQTAELESKAKENGTTIKQEADKLIEAEKQANKQAAVEALQEKAKKVSPINSVVNLPITGVKAIESNDGSMMFLADNGRYAFVGQIIDVWQQKELTTMKEIQESATTLPVKALGLKPNGLNALQMGKGEQHVSIFVDPQCGWCHKLIEEVQKDEDLLNRFVFDLYVVPALGDQSNVMAKRLFCSSASNEEKLKAFMSGPEALMNLPVKEKCQPDGYDQTLVIAQMLGVQGVPYVIASDGRYVAGKPQNIRSFLVPHSHKE